MSDRVLLAIAVLIGVPSVLLGYIALANPRTKFVVYSRGSWETEGTKEAWIAGMERRFPRLRGRLVAFKVPLARPTFRHPDTGREIKAIVSALLQQTIR